MDKDAAEVVDVGTRAVAVTRTLHVLAATIANYSVWALDCRYSLLKGPLACMHTKRLKTLLGDYTKSRGHKTRDGVQVLL